MRQEGQFLDLLEEALAAPGELDRQLVLRDWLLDQGESEYVADEAILLRRVSHWNAAMFFGIGSGSGSGRGSGSGIGSGRGSGRGSGSGRGIGRGIDRGSGRGRGSEAFRTKLMRIGQRYLVHCGDWHTYCGLVVAQLGPQTFEWTLVSKIADTRNGDCWEALAAGDERLRREADYKHYTTKGVIPLAIAAFEWVGKLPQEVDS